MTSVANMLRWISGNLLVEFRATVTHRPRGRVLGARTSTAASMRLSKEDLGNTNNMLLLLDRLYFSALKGTRILMPVDSEN